MHASCISHSEWQAAGRRRRCQVSRPAGRPCALRSPPANLTSIVGGFVSICVARMAPHTTLEVAEGVAVVTLHNPPVNALHPAGKLDEATGR